MMIAVDDREHALIERLRAEKAEFEVRHLPLGDVMIENNGVTALIERKRADDFAASISDGRWREQKARLLKSGCVVIYIIEGSLHGQSKPATTLSSAMWNTMLRDNINVLQTRGVEDTSLHLQVLAKKIGVDIKGGGSGMRSLLSKRKRKQDNAFQLMLMALGLSEKISAALVGRYPTLCDLQSQLRSSPKALRQIQVTSNRRIGPATIKLLQVHLQEVVASSSAGI